MRWFFANCNLVYMITKKKNRNSHIILEFSNNKEKVQTEIKIRLTKCVPSVKNGNKPLQTLK